jgi:hypothetical protein
MKENKQKIMHFTFTGVCRIIDFVQSNISVIFDINNCINEIDICISFALSYI